MARTSSSATMPTASAANSNQSSRGKGYPPTPPAPISLENADSWPLLAPHGNVNRSRRPPIATLNAPGKGILVSPGVFRRLYAAVIYRPIQGDRTPYRPSGTLSRHYTIKPAPASPR